MTSKSSRSDLIPVLMLAPFFAPQTHAAMFRAHKLARYLPEHGFRPIVVTTDLNYLYNDDPGLLAELPPEAEIHRARYIEPTLRGVRMALGGQDRTFAALKSAGRITTGPASAPASGAGAMERPGGTSFGSIVSRFISDYPDRHWTWVRPAFRLASRLIGERGIRLMYSSANPVSFLRAAIRLRQRHDLRWLFDARDPLGYGRKHSAARAIPLLQERAILRRSMEKADHVTGLAQSYGQIFFDLYGLNEDRYSFIPTGLDEAYLPRKGAAPAREDFLLHVGEVMPDQSPYVFRVLERLLASPEGASSFDRLVFVGRREINEPRVRRLISELPNLQARLAFIDHRPQTEVYDLIRRARACLLVPGAMRYWWTSFAKLADYIALGAPVVAHVPPISEARHELDRAGTGFFLQSDEAEDASKLKEWLAGSAAITRQDYADRYTARRQVADFAMILRQLHDKE